MGACDFIDIGYGKSAQEAFSSLRESAAWECGHGGYTGTIAEKHSYRIFTTPSEMDVIKFVEWVMFSHVALYPDPENEYYQEWLKEGPEVLRDRAVQIYRSVQDKWGPAGCIEWPLGTDEKVPRQMKDGEKRFVFFGYASS